MAAAAGKYEQICTQHRTEGVSSVFGNMACSVNAGEEISNGGVLGSEHQILLLAGKSITHVGTHVVIASPTVVMQAGENITLNSPDPEHPVKLFEIQQLALAALEDIRFHNVRITSSDERGIQGRIMAKRVIIFVDQEPVSVQDVTLIKLVKSLINEDGLFEVRRIVQ